MAHFAAQELADQSKICEASFQKLQARAFSWDPEDVLRGARIALDDRYSEVPQLVRQAGAPLSESLHALYQAWIDVHTSLLQDSFTFASNPVLIAARVIIACPDASPRE